MSCAAGEAERKRLRTNEIYHFGQCRDTKKAEGKRRDGILVRPRHRTTRAAVCASRAHLHGLRKGCGRQRETEKTVQPSALVLKGERDRRKANELRSFPPISYERAKTVVERERKKVTRKRYEIFAGL